MKFKTTPEQRAALERGQEYDLEGDEEAIFVMGAIASVLSDLDAAQAQIAELERERDELRALSVEVQIQLADVKRDRDGATQDLGDAGLALSETLARAEKAEAMGTSWKRRAAELERERDEARRALRSERVAILNDMLRAFLKKSDDGYDVPDFIFAEIRVAIAASRAEEKP